MFEHCDFCGGEAIVVPCASESFHVCCISPDGCKMVGPAATTREDALAKWREVQDAIRAARELDQA